MKNMSKQKGFALIAIPLVLCVSLLIGYTMAWFTDEATNSDNEIAAGTLSVELLKCESTASDYLPIGDKKLFDTGYWEPGTTKIACLAVKNTGSLALEYNVQLIVEEGAIPLSEVMEYALVSPMSKKDAAGLDSWSKIATHNLAKTKALAKGVNTLEADKALKPGNVTYFLLAIHMKDDASDRYQSAWMDLDLKITAKQAPSEKDFFGNQYDADSEYVNGATSSANWINLIKGGPLGFENGLEENISVLKGTAEAMDDNTRPNSKKVLKINPGSRVQFNQPSNIAELTVGIYKLAGYVKAGDADLSKVTITIWAYKNSVSGTNIVTPVVADNIIVEDIGNGWSYFEMMFDHGAAYSLLQIIIENGNAEGDVYFDDIEYLKYVGKEELPSLVPEVEDDGDPDWDTYANLDFEGSKFPMVQNGEKPVGDLGVPGRGDSLQSLRLEGSEQVKYSKSRSLAAGYYRLSGYVNLGNVMPGQVYTRVWAYTGTSEGNLKSGTMANFIVGEPDADGWYYFEIIFQHKVNYSLMQFIIENSSTTGTVYFDDIVYAKYVGEGSPEPDTPVVPVGDWTTHAKLDFEGSIFPMVANGNYTLGGFGTPGYGTSSKALQLDGTQQAKYSVSVQLPAGHYRLSGYIKLGAVKAENVHLNVWARKDASSNETKGGRMSALIIGEADENGWSYFEVDFQHNVDYTLLQFTVANYSSSGTVYLDDIVYAQYNGKGEPPATEAPETPDTPEPGDPGTSTETWGALAELDFEGTEFPMTEGKTNYPVGGFGTPGHGESEQNLELGAHESAKYNGGTVSMAAGWYRLSGYVKMDTATTDVTVNVWVNKNEEGVSNLLAGGIKSYIVGPADEDGWYYFEIDFEHKATYGTLQFTLVNYSGYTACFDDIVYAKYNDEGQPEPTPAPETPAPDVWNEFAELDFETDVTLTQKQGTYSVIADATREDSTKVLQVAKSSRVQYSQDATLPKGYYRVSGYVKLGDADPSKVSVSIWAYKNSTGTNPVTPTMADSIIGPADENGWCYFEMDFDHGENYSLVQIILNNYDTANTVLFDDVVYAQYTGEGEPPATEAPEVPAWTETLKLDFEGDFPLIANGNYTLADTATPGYNSNTAAHFASNTQAKYTNTISMSAGWYRLSGYIKADPTKLADFELNIWSKGESGNVLAGGRMSTLVVGGADENGWYYFEVDFEHKAAYTLAQFTMKSYSSQEILVDEIVYAKYNGEGEPPATEAPAEPDPNWDALTGLDFETDKTLTAKSGTHSVIADNTRTGSTKVLQIDKNSRVQYSEATTTSVLTVGDYKLTGYVKLGNANAASVSITIWAYKHDGTNNTVTPTIADCIVGEADANGWSYFEMPFNHGQAYTGMQFILNNYDTSNAVLFDDIQYMKKVAE